MMPINLQRRRADDFATSDKLGLQVLPSFRQLLIWPDMDMLHVPLQLELKTLKLIGKRSLLWISKLNADELPPVRQVPPMVDARRRNLGPFDHLPQLVHEV